MSSSINHNNENESEDFETLLDKYPPPSNNVPTRPINLQLPPFQRATKIRDKFYPRTGADEILAKLKNTDRFDDSCDLHGHTLEEAQVSLENFLSYALQEGHQTISIIHGKGLHSANYESILLHAVRYWLSRCKYVNAWSKAAPYCGDDGATVARLKEA